MLSVIIVAAGSSERMGFDKVFAPLERKPVIAHTIDAFERTSCVDEIILVGRNDSLGELRKLLGSQTKVRQVVEGGAERQDSVRAGLDHVDPRADYVAVHDAARPLITPEKITRVFEVSCTHGAAALAESVTDTLKRADLAAVAASAKAVDSSSHHGGQAGQVLVIKESVDRHQVFAMQTPQIFARKLLVEAYKAAAAKKISVTDEVSAVEQLGRRVVLVPNQDFNFKMTYPRDLKLAELILQQRAGSR